MDSEGWSAAVRTWIPAAAVGVAGLILFGVPGATQERSVRAFEADVEAYLEGRDRSLAERGAAIDGRLAAIRQRRPPPPAPPPGPRPAAPRSAGPGAEAPAGAWDAIREVAPGRYLVGAAAIDRAIEHIDEVAESVRAVPYHERGEARGYTLLAIAPDGPVHRMGLRDRDVVVSVNDINLGDPEARAGLLQSLTESGTRRFTLRILRGEEVLTLHYEAAR